MEHLAYVALSASWRNGGGHCKVGVVLGRLTVTRL
jgi:hypothetical protein